MRASDGDQTTDATVTVDVTDVAEAPSFAQAGYTFALAENADGSVARLSLGTVSATDPDGGSVSYGIEGGNESGRFEIGAASGELFYVGGGEDYETGSTSFELTVRASDGDRTTDTAVTVNVTDVDEPVAVDPPVAQEVQSVPQTVSEGATDLPNDNSTPGRVAVGGSATGTIGRARDNDRFAVELEAGRTYQFDLEGSPGGGGTLPDTYFRAIYNSDGRYQSGSYNDNFDGSRDSRVTFTPTASGTHYARVSGDRDEVGSYTLRVTDMTAPETGGSSTNPVPPEPQEPTVDFVGPDETVPQESTSEPDDQGQAVPPQPDTSQAQGEPASVSEGDTDLPADSTTTGRVAVGGWVRGDIDVSYDKDWFAVDLKADTEYEIVMAGGSWIDRIYHGSLVSPQIHGVYTADATKIVGGGSRQGNPKSVLVTPEEDGTYYVQTGGWVNRVGAYTLSVTDLSVEPTDDYADDIDTEGTVAVGGSAGSATGNIEVGSDIDWFAVTLEADKIYRFDLEGSPTGDGSLPDPVLRGIYDADGERLPGTGNNNYIAGEGRNSAVYFTPDDSGTYYVAAAAGSIASGWDKHPGTYTLTVTDFDESGDDYVAVPNSAKTGTVMVGGSAATGDIETAGDYDWFAVALDAGKFYRVDMRGVTLQDTFLSGVYDDDGDRSALPSVKTSASATAA